MCADAFIPKTKREEDIIKSVNVILARERKPMTLSEICQNLRGVNPLELQSIAWQNLRGVNPPELQSIASQNPSNFECFEDGQLFVKQITKVGICELHTSAKKACPGSTPDCTGLHICKFYILTGQCHFGGQCKFGHDLYIDHNLKILKENYLECLPEGDLKYLFTRVENRTSVTVPKICKFYNLDAGCRYYESGKGCLNLHICKHYIRGKCCDETSCLRSHNIMSSDIKAILEKYGINTGRTQGEILADLREAVMQAGCDDLPRPPVSSLRRRPPQMPIPPYAGPMSGQRPSHPLSAQRPLRPLSAERPPRPLSAQRPPRPLSVQRPPRPLSAQRPPRPSYAQSPPRPSSAQRPLRPSSAQRPPTSGRPGISQQISTDQVICFFHLRDRCAYGESCRNFHADLLYQWVYKLQGDVEWKKLPDPVNLELELSYSDPANQECYMDIGQKVKIIFKTMTGTSTDGQNYDVHRFSTASSVEFERQPLTTEWVWYWKDQIGQWRKYGEDNTTGYEADILSTDLEQAYIANPDGSLAFSTLCHEYILDFPKMVQRNLHYKTEREVCRRPVFVSRQDFEQKKMQVPSGRRSGQSKGVASGVGMVTAPPHWQITPDTDIMDHCQIVEVSKRHPSTRKEYKEIESLFCESMTITASVKSIERVENGELWYNYVSKKAKMLKKNNNKDVGERRLFHGTTNTYVDAICRQGFDFRLSGQSSGTVYGKGSYFATTSKYSDCYTDQTKRVMFVVKVLVGEYAKGNSEYVRPPSKDRSKPCSELYDSCVDDQRNPSIFVIFDNNGQVYPEYLIRYEYKYEQIAKNN